MNKSNYQNQISAIYKRTSTRLFQNKPIPSHVIREILDAGTMAPASGNMQPWEFIMVENEQIKHDIVEQTFGGFYSKLAKNQDWILTAPIIMVACVNFKRTVAKYGDLGYKWATIDTALAVENMLLVATDLGISSCWVGGFLEKEICSILQIPAYVKPIGLIPMGYSAEEAEYKQKIHPEWITHKNKYNEPYF